jgi:hypothetical protein
VTPCCNFVARKVRPNTDLTFVSARRTTPALYLNLRRDKWLRIQSIFFVNTTGGLFVTAFKLCQEGNWEPLIERIVFRKRIV